MTRRTSPILLLSVSVLLVASLACGMGAKPPDEEVPESPTVAPGAPATDVPAEPTATLALAEVEGEPTKEPATGQTEHDTVFPLPDDVQGFMGTGGEGMVNFQTSLGLEEVMEFYRQAFSAQGLTEREALRVIEDGAFSMVFDGWDNGQAVVIQGVDLGRTTNVNIRFEDI